MCENTVYYDNATVILNRDTKIVGIVCANCNYMWKGKEKEKEKHNHIHIHNTT